MTALNTRFRIANQLTWVSYLSLLILFLVTHFIRANGPNWVVLLLQCGPLLILLPGLIARHYRSYSWLCFIILLYFVMAVQSALSSNSTVYDGVFVGLTVCIFIFGMFASRYAQRITKNIPLSKSKQTD